MIEIQNTKIKQLLSLLVDSFANDVPLESIFYDEIQAHPEYGIDVMEFVIKLDEDFVENDDSSTSSSVVMACFHYIEMCLIQLKLAEESFKKWADSLIQKYQSTLLKLMTDHPESLYWLPIINLFYEADIEINQDIQNKYLAILDSHQKQEDRVEHQQILVEQLLSDDSEASEYDIAELFFAQTNALPREYFPSFLKELISFNLTKAVNTTILFLLHPVMEVRNLVQQNILDIFGELTLPPESMSRLLMIRHWLPEDEKGFLEPLLTLQRKKGATFAELRQGKIVEILATEMDGSGAQALFLLIKRRKGYQAGGLLVKRYFGIKDTWLSPLLKKEEAKNYAQQSLQGSFYLRKVDQQYLDLIIADHIYHAHKLNSVPHIHLLRLQEITTSQWQASPLDIDLLINQLKQEMPELDDEYIQKSLKRSGNWYKKYYFTESWFDENPDLDRLVTQHCSFIDGIKHCDMSSALQDVMANYFEPRREQWLDHFLWLCLWAKPAAKHNEYLWRDAFVIVNALYNNEPLLSLPIIQIICEHSILQSVESMESRKTHLS